MELPEGLSRGGVIICHGMLSSRRSVKLTALGQRLARQGLAALRFDFAGRGDSGGDTLLDSYTRRVEDLDGAVDWMKKEVGGPLGLVGSSMGAAVALIYASRFPGVAAVVALATAVHPARLAGMLTPEDRLQLESTGRLQVEGGAWIGRDLVRDSLNQDILGAARELPCPALFIHGGQDTLIPVSEARKIAGVARSKLVLIEGADHPLSGPEHQRYFIRETMDFLLPVLGGDNA